MTKLPVTDETTAMLALNCVECCGQALCVSFPIHLADLAKLLEQKGWYLSVMSPPGALNLLTGVLCSACARKVHDPKVLDRVEGLQDDHLS